MKFAKYQALGNAYILIEPADQGKGLTTGQIQQICDVHYGLGSDGVLLRSPETSGCDFALQIFNPDGSEAEKSGNGLRIFARYLYDQGLVIQQIPFTIHTAGGKVTACVHPGGEAVTVEMGQVSFDNRRIPMTGPDREVIDEILQVNGQELRICAATIGNPHCIVLREEISAEEAKRLGPLIENSPSFPNRTNVQFMKVLYRRRIQIEIWERGAGYTLASGSSSCAAAAAAYRLGRCDAQIEVYMPGGKLDILISEELAVSMTGPVTKICEGFLFEAGKEG